MSPGILFLCLVTLGQLPTASAGPQGGQDLSDDDIIEALALLLSETEDRRGRQEFGGGQERPVFNLDLDDLELDRASAGRQLSRQDFEDVQGTCTTTGYEVSTREECEEVNEIKCTPINVTKYELKIVTRCETQIDKKCNITYIDVPAQDCKPRPRNRCETLYKRVEDTEYREECAVDVQHMCEHRVPIPVPVEVPYQVPKEYQPPVPPMIGPQLPPDKNTSPIFSAPSIYSGHIPPAQISSDGYLPPASMASEDHLSSAPVVSGHLSPSPSLSLSLAPPHPAQPALTLGAGVTTRPPLVPYQYDPTPGPTMAHAVSSIQPLHAPPHLQPFLRNPRTLSPLAYSLFEKLNATRSKRSVVFSDDDVSEVQLKGLVKQILDKVLASNQELNNVRATIRDSRSINPVSFDLNVPHSDHLGGRLVDKYPPPSPSPHPSSHYPKEPIITTHELPAPEGCRSFATKECHKIPIVVPRKIPYEVCEVVPDIECVNVLKKVPELQCTPEIFEDCNDVEKRVPYLVPEEDCVEVTFDECQEITERVPVELCKRKRINENVLTLSKGKVERKEGEKRRTPAFRRGVKQTNTRSKKKNDLK